MPVTAVLTPAAVAIEDYPIITSPSLGGEMDVFLTTKQARLLGIFTVTTDGGAGEYEYFCLPTSATPGPIVAVVQGDLRSGSAATVTFGGIVGTFSPPLYAKNQKFDFPVGKAAELVGTYTAVTSSSVPTVANAKRGSRFALIEMPVLTDFTQVGSTTSEKIKVPTSTGKAIGRKLESSFWTTQGKTEVGSLEISGLDDGPDDGLRRFGGMKCVAMIRVLREGQIVARREFYLDWTAGVDQDNPESDGETKLSLNGMFSRQIILTAPGTEPA